MLFSCYIYSIFFRFYSVVAPGDTVHIIGKFDYEEKCDVNHEKNF